MAPIVAIHGQVGDVGKTAVWERPIEDRFQPERL